MRTLREELILIGVKVLVFFFILIAGLSVFGTWYDDWSGFSSTTVSDGVCNIAVVPIQGDIMPFAMAYDTEDESGVTYPSTIPDDIDYSFQLATDDENIQGILVTIDSLGGTPEASEHIMNIVKRSSVPVVALIRESGTSGAYLIATGANTIIASPFSDIGSIGVTMSYLENVDKNDIEGLRFVSLSSTTFKDIGNPNKPLTEKERELLERDLKIYHDQFVKEVAENRGLPIEDVQTLADGSSMPGTLALEKKLIDELGDESTAREWFAKTLGLATDEVIYCK